MIKIGMNSIFKRFDDRNYEQTSLKTDILCFLTEKVVMALESALIESSWMLLGVSRTSLVV